MDPDETEGRIKNGIGKVEAEMGEVLGDPGLELQGEVHQLEGAAEEALGAAKNRIEHTAKRAKSFVENATEQATDTYDSLRRRAEAMHDTVDPFVHERPYAAVLLGALAGFVLGVVYAAASGSPRVIYVKPRD